MQYLHWFEHSSAGKEGKTNTHTVAYISYLGHTSLSLSLSLSLSHLDLSNTSKHCTRHCIPRNEWTFNPCHDSYLTIVSLFLIYLPVAFQWISQEPVRVRFHVQQRSGWTKQRGRAWDVCCVWRKVWQGWSWSTHRSYWQLLHAIGMTWNDPRMAAWAAMKSQHCQVAFVWNMCFFVTCSFLGTPRYW